MKYIGGGLAITSVLAFFTLGLTWSIMQISKGDYIPAGPVLFGLVTLFLAGWMYLQDW